MELLLLLAANSAQAWTVQQLVSELRSSETAVSRRVKQLLEGGFLEKTGETFRFAPGTAEKAAACEKLRAAYSEYQVRVIELIYSRSRALEDFSNAFRIKSKE
jgi:DNA-binding IclR family transcriptional regulator